MSDDEPTRVTIERMNELSVAFAEFCIKHKVAGIELPLVIANALSSNGIDLKEFAQALGWAYQQVLERNGVVVEVGQPLEIGPTNIISEAARKAWTEARPDAQGGQLTREKLGAPPSNVVPLRRPVGSA